MTLIEHNNHESHKKDGPEMSIGRTTLESLLEQDRSEKTRAPAFVETRDVTVLWPDQRTEWIHIFDNAGVKMEEIVSIAHRAVEASPDVYAYPSNVEIHVEVEAKTGGGVLVSARAMAKAVDGLIKKIEGATFSFTKEFPATDDNREREQQKKIMDFWALTLGRGLMTMGKQMGVNVWVRDHS